MSGGRVDVVVADDHPLFREALTAAVGGSQKMRIVGAAADGADALVLLEARRPDVALIDLRMPGLSGLQVLQAARSRDLPTRVLLMSAERDGRAAHEALELGGAGFISKVAQPSDVLDAICRAARGGVVLSPELQDGVFQRIAESRSAPAERLTPREREILQLASNGASSGAIGAALVISPATVKTHMQRAFEKLGVNDRTAAVAEAMRRGLIS